MQHFRNTENQTLCTWVYHPRKDPEGDKWFFQIVFTLFWGEMKWLAAETFKSPVKVKSQSNIQIAADQKLCWFENRQYCTLSYMWHSQAFRDQKERISLESQGAMSDLSHLLLILTWLLVGSLLTHFQSVIVSLAYNYVDGREISCLSLSFSKRGTKCIKEIVLSWKAGREL